MRHALLPASALLALVVAGSTFAGGSSDITNSSFEFPEAPAGG